MKNRKRNRKNKKTLQIIYHEIITKNKTKKSSSDYPENRTIFLPENAGSIDPGSKSYDAGPSNRVTQEVLRRELTAPEIAGKYQIHPGKTETPRLQQESGTEELSALLISKLAVGRLRNMVAQRLSPGLFIQNSPAGGEAQQHRSTKSSRKTATDYVTRRGFPAHDQRPHARLPKPPETTIDRKITFSRNITSSCWTDPNSSPPRARPNSGPCNRSLC